MDDRKRTTHTDVVVIGSGIGGLCCAAMLARYGYRVTLCEAHSIAGGVAHSFEVKGFHFDSGPSFLLGLSDPHSINPLKHALDLLGEPVPCVRYRQWNNHLPEGLFRSSNDQELYTKEIEKFAGPKAAAEWRELERRMIEVVEPLAGLPQTVMRSDAAALLPMLRYPRSLLGMRRVREFSAPFSNMVDEVVSDPWLKNLLDLESFVLSGLGASETMLAVIGFMYRERIRSTVDYPIGGMQAIVDGLLRGLSKNGGKLMLKAEVDSILVEKGRAVGVQLVRGGRVLASRAVVSNASVWDTLKILPEGALPEKSRQERAATKQTDSFMHLHVGIDAEGLPPGLDCHHLVLRHWNVTAPQNLVLISIPSIFDPSLAPEGKHVIHAYLAGNEPYEIWDGVKRGTPEYKQLKADRSQVLWEAVEKVIPDVRERAEVKLVGSPITIERFCRRDRGTYGPVMDPSGRMPFPGPKLFPVRGLYHCGDSCLPSIGVPSVAGSGITTANTIAPVWKQWRMLDEFDRLQAEAAEPPHEDFQHLAMP